jgi:uncharacterized protein
MTGLAARAPGLMRSALALLAVVFGALSLTAPARAAPTFPALTGRVVDDAHVLSPQTQAALTAKLAALEQKNGDQLVVVTLRTLQGDEIADYGYQLGRAWGIGQKGKDNGAIFIVAPSEHKVRIEVGYGLEPVLTDAMSSVILQSAVLPKFRAGDIEGGVSAGTDAIIQQLGLDPEAAAANAKAAAQQAEAGPAGAPPFRLPIALIIIVLVFVLPAVIGRFGFGGGGGLWALPFLFMGGGGYRGGGDGGFGGGGDGGGGFGGGGGSFGGGGSSGGW